MAKSLAERLLSPKIALPVLAAALIATILLQPTTAPQSLFSRGVLSSDSVTPGGARGLYEIAGRLGWPESRRRAAFTGPLDSDRVYLVLDPPVSPTIREAHAMLDAVRRGAGLVYVVREGQGSALNDSLHVAVARGSVMVPQPPLDCPREDAGSPVPMWADDSVRLYSIKRSRAWPDDTALFVAVRSDTDGTTTPSPAAVGYRFGQGRVVVVSDADLFRNDVLRVCRYGLGPAAVRMLDYASAGKRPVLVFEERHFGARPGIWSAIGDFLTDTSEGRTLAQIAAAALILLAAAAWRPVAPTSRKRIERRSALEHVAALARAYARVNATRTAVRRLVRGLRRRHSRKGVRNDEAYLRGVAVQNPPLADDVQHILHGVSDGITPAELLAVGRAVDHIDRVLGK
ncbi:MAG TPA: DUF4350 domain-containing protein [Gemmatimonadaceae bacterium]|nr:DUF4350 domain-containing protein [Gemmatimonadaceae bacterium]